MTNKLISLVIIIFILSIGHSYSNEQFLFPKEKPSIFKKINKDPEKSFSSNLPQKKPLTNQEKEQKKDAAQKQKVVVVDKKVDLKEKKEVKKEVLTIKANQQQLKRTAFTWWLNPPMDKELTKFWLFYLFYFVLILTCLVIIVASVCFD